MGYKIKFDPILDEFVFDHGFGDRITDMEDTYVRLEIFEEVSSTSGTLSVPTGAVVVLDQFAEDVDALCTVIPASGQKPEEELERTAGGNLVTVTLSGTGNADYDLSGIPQGIQYAIQYVVDIKFVDLPNINRDIVLTADEVKEPYEVLKFDIFSTYQVLEGEMAWGQDDGTLNVGMPGGNVVGQMFQELYVPKRPSNVSGSIMPNGTVVFISGETGAVPEISLADASTEALSMATIGLTTEEIAVGGRGYVTTVGLVRDVDTSTFASGAAVWLSGTAGQFTDTKPSTPAHAVMIGTVNRVHDTEGEILLNIANGWETYELHDVDDTIPTVTGQNWTWDVASGYYKLRTSRLYNDNNWSFQPGADSTTAWQLKDQAGNEAVNYDSINDILNISGVDPEIRLTDTGNNEYTRITRADTDNVAQRFNRISSTINKALDFDGAGDYVNVPHDASFNFGTGDFTMFTWIRNTQNPAQHNTVFCKGDPESANEWCFQVLNSKYLNFRTNATGYTSSITIVDGVDTLIGVTRVGTTLKLYSNNVEVGSFTSSDNLTNSEDLHIGFRGVAYNGYLNAVTDESGIYSRGLTSDDFTDLYNSGAGLYVDKAINFPTSGTSMGLNLEALWHYDQSSGTSLPDSSVNSNIGTLINMDDSDWVAGKVINPSLVILEVNVWKSFDSGYLWGDSTLPTVFEGTAFGFNNLSPVAFLDAVIPLSTQVGDLLTGAVSQSANLRENRKSDGTLYSGINNIGERFNYDNVKNWFGTSDNASIYYYNGDLFINTRESGTGNLRVLGGKLGIQCDPTYICSLNGESAQTIWMEREQTANTAGNDLTIQAGGAPVGATDKDGGDLILSGGISTGNGFSSVRIGNYKRGTSGTDDNTFQERFTLPCCKGLEDNVAIDLFEIALFDGDIAGGHIHYTITATDGTDHQCHSGTVTYAAVNKAGSYSTNISEQGETTAGSAGNILDTFAITPGTNKITISLNANSTLTPTVMRLIFSVFNNSRNEIIIL